MPSRQRRARRPVPPADGAARLELLGRAATAEACSAGRIPNSRPVRSAAPSVNSSTDTSIRTGFTVGIGSDLTDCSSRTPHQAAARPASAPARGEQDALGQQLAHDAASARRRAPTRIASSRRRPPARISSRLATLAHATSSTSATAPRQDQQRLADAAASAAPASGRPPRRPSRSSRGYCCSSRFAMTDRSACAWLTVTPGLRRPMAR